ncbi:unnamed protein product [Cuscuta europaea]|uniref:Germin-like protein n=1 Tax=Cuscuta europaea TaxID=41803 RepID=A0A9P0YVV5_CUSEU|nr:unnamed protein product [Cuscuta europaea]
MVHIMPLKVALAIIVVVLAASPLACASDPDKLQDFCVAVKDSEASGRDDFGPYGVSTPHFHPLATEVVTVLEGTVYVGFIDSRNKLCAKMLLPGDIFVLPKGLIHFLYNTGHRNAAVFAAFGSQNPASIHLPNDIFGSDPPILPEILSKAFLLDKNVISRIQSQIQSELSE